MAEIKSIHVLYVANLENFSTVKKTPQQFHKTDHQNKGKKHSISVNRPLPQKALPQGPAMAISSKHIKYFIFTLGIILIFNATFVLEQPLERLNKEIITRQTWRTLIGAGLVVSSSIYIKKGWYFIYGSFSAILGALLMHVKLSTVDLTEIQGFLTGFSRIIIIFGLVSLSPSSTKKNSEQPIKKDP